MNDVVNQMKQQVGALMSGQPDAPSEGQVDAGNTDAGTNGPDGGHDVYYGDDGGNQPNVSQSESGQGDSDTPELSERDQRELDKAIASGWKTEDDFKGHPEDFIKPREWNRTVALYRRLDRESDERRRLEQEVSSFGERIKNVMEVAKAKAVAELEAKKREAVESADYGEVQRLDNEIKQTNEDYEVELPERTAQPIRPEVEDWMAENTWFEQDQDMTEFALSFQHAQLSRLKDPGNPTSEELKRALNNTSRALRNEFPDKFQTRRAPKHTAHSLEPGRRRSGPRKFTVNDLTAEEKTVLENIERLPGGMSREEYIQAIQDMRGK